MEESLQEKEISRATEKRQTPTNTHINTLALLNETQSTLKQSKLTCDMLKEKLQKQLTERLESFQRELSEMEESFMKELSEKERIPAERTWQRERLLLRGRKEPSETVERSRKELSTLSENWERRARQWERNKRELEAMLLVKEKM
ncbi:golgin subfamily A member 6-like protein 22 [Scomber scombrus]|uniref:Golgin subfamily A member 6-like protein 22 n=1 Tax=Scomber scombrus TaxID=13677 RepID=A0AAV1PGY3_SCOSC